MELEEIVMEKLNYFSGGQQQEKITNAYGISKNIYDDVLTQKDFLAKLYIKLFWGVADIELAERVLNFIPDDFSGKLLDIPVGTAFFTFQKFGKLNKAYITCIDYSNEMLDLAKKRLHSTGHDKLVCMHGDVGNLPFNDGTFDILLSLNGFHAFPDKCKAFSEKAMVWFRCIK
jgi:ubiquinone/menaquinone biosynthesis C-methylase UbiE